ncbi:MAG: VOC family protein [Anaerococcus prevotii]|uniref:lactoylglutathione lyase n=1 Tax=Anaerococcus prevotii TaxID=33034 RepID=UPI0029028613|nr:VOC family protein [Anaerococcus prevotii]MDU2557583.1 VOC family protein [Anaerococcus prevotii]MDU2585522.1 VOC family protein [Anaerococcus prevotii]
MKFLHTMIRVKNLDKSYKFYTEELGFVESRRKEFPDKKFDLVYLKLPASPDYELELTYNYDQEEAYDLGNGYGHIAISNPDIKSFRKELSDKGYEVTELRGLSDNSDKYFFVEDPDGYKIEIIQKK